MEKQLVVWFPEDYDLAVWSIFPEQKYL